MENCPHCDPSSFALERTVLATSNFSIVCDAHPLVEGHILIIPKRHISCAGAFSQDLFEEFLSHFQPVSTFISDTYGTVSSFEHGVIGQTVFHAHVHVLPYNGEPTDIVPEGMKYLRVFPVGQLRKAYKKEGKYLFLSIGNRSWIVNSGLGQPRFFRDRFAQVLGVRERGDWKSMHNNAALMQKVTKENESVQVKWKKWSKTRLLP